MGRKIGGFAAVVAKTPRMIEPWTEIVVKLGGALCGSALALVYGPPTGFRDFIRRGLAGMIGGAVFAPYVRGLAGFSADWEGLLMGATLAAFASWHVMGAIIQMVKRR
jgi:hypothetical protein